MILFPFQVRHIVLPVCLFCFFACSTILPETQANEKNSEGLAYLDKSQYNEAIQSFKEASMVLGVSTELKARSYRNISQVFFELNEPDSSIYYSTLAAKCYDLNTYGYLVNMADVDILTGRTSSALVKLKRAIPQNPNEIPAYNALGLIYLGTYGAENKNLDSALVYNQKAYEISQARNVSYVLALNLFELGKYTQAEKLFTELNEQYPESILHPLMLGLTKLKLGKSDEAEQYFLTVIELDTSYSSLIQEYKSEAASAVDISNP